MIIWHDMIESNFLMPWFTICSSMDNKKPSGAQYRKRRAEKAKEQAKQEGSFLKFLKRSTPEKETETAVQEEVRDVSGSSSENYSEDQPLDPSRDNQADDETEPVANYETQNKVDYGDPATWPMISDPLTVLLVQNKPQTMDYMDYPRDQQNRKFSQMHYKRRLANGEEVQRSWLMYSKSSNAVYCFSCKLFSKKSGVSSLQDDGCRDWKNLAAILSSHEKSTTHLETFQAWRELEVRLATGKTIDDKNQQLMRQEEEYWQQVLERLIALARVLAQQNLAFRGSSDRVFTQGNGNFLKFVEFLAMFDPLMKEHLRKITAKETKIHYLGKDVQNELISLLGTSVKQHILDDVKRAKYFAIILDCTPDISHNEQMTMIVRFVDCPINDDADVQVREHFLSFVPLEETTGAFMTDVLLQQFEEMGLLLDNLRGQGYDNGSNMKGKENGVQRRILDKNPRAFFVPCNAHSLNLVVNDAAKSCLEAVNFFGLVQQISNFFSGSTRRWGVLREHITDLTVKPLSETRWESRIDALKPLRYHLHKVYDALVEINEDQSQKGVAGTSTRAEAQSLANNIAKFPFMVSLVTWYSILFEINITSKLLQDKSLGMQAATAQLEKTKDYLCSLRSDDAFSKIVADATEIAQELEVEPAFQNNQVRRRRKKRQFEYEGQDEDIQDPKENYKVKFYFAILDVAISSIEERFKQLQQHNDLFGFLYDIHSISDPEKTTKQLHASCHMLEKSLRCEEDKDIDGDELCGELQALSRRLPKAIDPQGVLNFLKDHKLMESFPNISVALRVLLTLPVSVASGERSFSKLKLIKSYLRSTMSQERLVGLATISIESELANSIDIRRSVSEFAKQKARKVKF